MKKHIFCHTRIRSGLIVILAAALILSLAACGGSGGSSPGTPSQIENSVNITDDNAPAVAGLANSVYELGVLPGDFANVVAANEPFEAGPKQDKRFRVAGLAKLAQEQLERLDQVADKDGLSAMSLPPIDCTHGGNIIVSETDTSLTITFNNCKEREGFGDWWWEETQKGTIKISQKDMQNYGEGFAFVIDLQVFYEDADNDYYTETLKGSFDYGFTDDNDYKLIILGLTLTDSGIWFGESYSDAVWIDNFNLVSKPVGSGYALTFDGVIGSTGDWGIGGSIHLATTDEVTFAYSYSLYPNAGKVVVNGAGNSTLVLEYFPEGVEVTINNGTPVDYTWFEFEEWAWIW